MKKLAGMFVAATLAAFGSNAGAVSLGPNGIGQALIYPYYTVNKDQDTLISVVNASGASKVVQVRFREGMNGRDVLSFLLFLSPHDVWTASITQTDDAGAALLRTSDASCTAPAIPAAGVAFRTAGYDGTGDIPEDGGPTSSTRTREGFVEMIAQADLAPGSATDIAITHVDGVPPDCDYASTGNVQHDEVAETNGIYGSGSIINVAQGTFFPYTAEAIQGFSDVPLWDQSGGGITLAFAYSADALPGATAYVEDGNARPLALAYDAGIDAVSAVLMTDAIWNEYIVASSLGANTDWVVTFPTKQFYVDSVLYGPGTPYPPFVEEFAAPGQSAVPVSGVVYDREELAAVFPEPCTICPPPASEVPALLYEVNVIGVGVGASDPSGVFGSTLRGFSLDPLGDDGHVVMQFGSYTLPGGTTTEGASVALAGLPVTGFMAYNVINTNAQPGLLANYSGLFRHRSTTTCLADIDGCNASPTGAGE